MLLKKSLVTAKRVYGAGKTVVVVSQKGKNYKIMTEYDGFIYEDEASEDALRGAQ